jgi:hypothetical protein
MNPNGELKRYLEALGELPDDIPHGHPAEEALISYPQGSLSAQARGMIDLHIRDCVVCATRLQDAQDFFAPARANEREMSEFEVHRQWRELRQQLPFESKPILGRISQSLGTQGMLAIAAGLLLTTSLMGVIALHLYQEKQELQALIDQKSESMAVRIAEPPKNLPKNLQEAIDQNRVLQEKLSQTQTQLQELQQPQINTPVSEITVGDTVRSEKNGRSELTTMLPPTANFFTIELNIVSDSFAAYEIAFLDASGKTVLRETNLRPNERAQETTPSPRPHQKARLSFSIPRGALPPGRYSFRVYGKSGPEQVLLESLNWTFQ